MEKWVTVDNEQISAILAASRLDELIHDRALLCRAFLKQIQSLTPFDVALIIRFNYQDHRFWLEYSEGIDAPLRKEFVPAFNSIDSAILHNDSLFQHEFDGISNEIGRILRGLLPELKLTFSLPLIANSQIIGLVKLGFKQLELVPAPVQNRLLMLSCYGASSLQKALDATDSEYRAWEISSLYQLNKAINSSLRFSEVSHIIVEEAVKLLNLDSCSILMNEYGKFHFRESYGIAKRKRAFSALLGELQFDFNQLLQQKLDVLQYDGASAFTNPQVREGLKRIRDIIILPLVFDDRVLGALLMCSPSPSFFRRRRLQLVQMIASQVATALKHANLYQNLEKQLREIKVSNEIVKYYTTEMKELNVKLQNRIRDLSTVYEITYAMSTELSGNSLLDLIMDKVIRVLGTDKGSIMLYDERTGVLDIRCARGMHESELLDLKLKPGEGVAGLALSSGEPVIVNDVAKDDRFKHKSLEREARHTSLGAFPLKLHDKVIGVLNIDKAEAFEPEEVDLTKALAQFASSAIENSNLFDELTVLFSNSISSLTAAIEAKDPYTRGHSDRVTRIASFIGKAMALGPDQQATLERAAHLHDIGKVGVSALILRKPGPLTAAEYEEVKDHATMGARIIAPIRKLAREAEIIKHHHERYDGGGYADGLAGEDIPLEARIIAVADALDAMVSERPYREPVPIKEAVAEIERCAGTQFDGEVVKQFIAALHGVDLEEWMTRTIRDAAQIVPQLLS